jgi:hypothetical protein
MNKYAYSKLGGVCVGVGVNEGEGTGEDPGDAVIDGVGVNVGVTLGVGDGDILGPYIVTCLVTILSSQPGSLFWKINVYVVPVDAAGKSTTIPATNWSRVIPDSIGVDVVDPVNKLNGPIALESKESLNIT